MKSKWIYCPVCSGKTHTMVREDTELKNFPLYCPKCKQESLVDVKEMAVLVRSEMNDFALFLVAKLLIIC